MLSLWLQGTDWSVAALLHCRLPATSGRCASSISPLSRRLGRLLTALHCWNCRINKPGVLFPGVACFLLAAIAGLFLHASNMDDVRPSCTSLPCR